MKIYRQGDVLLRTADLPRGSEKLKTLVILASPVTGHEHRLQVEDKESSAALYRDSDGTIFAVTEGKVALIHEEHGPHKLPSGTYKISFEIEYDPFEKVMRQVID